jgi:hypothetical protein
MNAFKVSSGLVLFRDVGALLCQNMSDMVCAQMLMMLWQVAQIVSAQTHASNNERGENS